MNDERPIEKLLRRAAKKRSDAAGTPPELHPANRRQLQAEVARQFPKPAASPRAPAPPFWVMLTRHWAYAVALIPVIGIVALVLLPSLSKSKSKATATVELAKNTPAEKAAASQLLADAPVTSQSPLVATTLDTSAKSDRDMARRLAGSGGGNNEMRRATVPLAITAPPPVALPEMTADRESTTRLAVPATITVAPTDSLRVNRESEHLAASIEGRAENADKAKLGTPYGRSQSVASKPVSPERRLTPGAKAEAPATVASTLSQVGFDATTAVVAKDTAANYTDSLKEPEPKTTLAVTNGGFFAAEASALKDYSSADNVVLARGGGTERQRTALNSQAFSNLGIVTAEAKRKDELTPPVLVNFKVEQAGRDLRVVDGDGSVYKGVVDEENTLYQQISARQQQKLALANDGKFNFKTPKQTEAVSALKKLEADNFYLYRVEGTNRTLNQNVVFTWNFVATNALATGNLNYQNTAQKLDATKLPSQFPALLQNSYINGRAQFGAGREVEVNAVPVQP